MSYALNLAEVELHRDSILASRLMVRTRFWSHWLEFVHSITRRRPFFSQIRPKLSTLQLTLHPMMHSNLKRPSSVRNSFDPKFILYYLVTGKLLFSILYLNNETIFRNNVSHTLFTLVCQVNSSVMQLGQQHEA